MKNNRWQLYIVACICFSIVGIMDFVEGKYLSGSPFIVLGLAYMCFSISEYKKRNESKVIDLSNIDLETLEIKLRSQIAEGKKIEAIKDYRIATGVGLKEAKEYVDSLSENNFI